jgi:hypothetical protein
MTTQEFSAAFDTLLNSYNTKANFGETASKTDIVLDEYEKSVFLTQAQDIVVKSYFSSATNPQGEGIDDSARRQVDFSGLIEVADSDTNGGIVNSSQKAFDSRGKMYKLPDKVLIVLNERLQVTKDGKTKNYVVVPISYSEYDRIMSRAYAQPLKKQCWRLFKGTSGTSLSYDIHSEIIPIEGSIGTGKNDKVEYIIRYIRRPKPIVLTNLSMTNQESLDIDGVSSVTECELNPILHVDILNKAFELAIIAKTRSLPMDKE